MFKAIGQWKIWAIAGGVMALMFGYIKILRAKNERLEHNEEVREVIDEIEIKQKTDKQEALENEKQAIEERVEANIGKSRRNRASKL